jgi:AcrR family transcriptional regulator
MGTLTANKPAARTLSGEKAQRIVAAMRESVAEVGIAGSTFERVSSKAEVSRGLLHYYFGTKENLLVEVIRRDTDDRVDALVSAVRKATTVDEVIAACFDAFSRTVNEESGYVYMVSELFVAGRHQPDIQRELGSLYSRARGAVAAVLREKQDEGVLALRFDAESVITHMFAAGDGAVLQLLTDPTLDAEAAGAASYQVYRFLLDTRVEAG